MYNLETKSENFIKNIISLRKINGLKQDEQADKYGLGRTGYASYEQGKSKPGFDTLLIIASANGITIDELLSDDITVVLKNKKKSKSYVDLEGSVKNDVSNEPLMDYNIEQLHFSPLMPEKAFASYNSGDVQIKKSDIEHYFHLPLLREKDDFVWQVSGDSMTPTFDNGDYLSCKIIPVEEFKMETPYLITVNHAPMLKRFIPSINKGFIICRSDNPLYRDFEVRKSEITSIAKILATIKFH